MLMLEYLARIEQKNIKDTYIYYHSREIPGVSDNIFLNRIYIFIRDLLRMNFSQSEEFLTASLMEFLTAIYKI